MYYVQRYKDTVLKVAKVSAFIPCEGADTELARNMDNACGIDYVLISKDKGLSRGVGCRIQEDRWSKKYRTFTIRRGRDNGMKTEFAKRKAAIDGGGTYPYLTLQGYVDTANDRIDRLANAKTAEIISYCEESNSPIKHTGIGQSSQADFYCIDWDDYQQTGRSIRIWENLEAYSA